MSSNSLFIAYRNVGLIGVAALILTFIVSSFQTMISLGCGIIVGLFPFISWQLLGEFYLSKKRSIPSHSQVRLGTKIICILIGLTKLLLITVILYVLFNTKWIMSMPFIIGMMLILPVIIISVLFISTKKKQ